MVSTMSTYRGEVTSPSTPDEPSTGGSTGGSTTPTTPTDYKSYIVISLDPDYNEVDECRWYIENKSDIALNVKYQVHNITKNITRTFGPVLINTGNKIYTDAYPILYKTHDKPQAQQIINYEIECIEANPV